MTGNVAFMFVCTIMVFFMTPGLAFFYGGMVRRKNALNTMMFCMAMMGIGMLLWFLCGYSLSFGKDHAGIIGDLNKRRGQVTGMESKGTARVVKAKVPLSEMFGYVTVLRTISSGRATSSMEFSHFEEVPANLAKEIIEKASGKRKDIE